MYIFSKNEATKSQLSYSKTSRVHESGNEL